MGSILEGFNIKIGISLALCGVPLAMLLNYFFPVVSWSPIVMMFSAICLYNPSGENVKNNRYLTSIITFQVLMLIYWFLFDSNNYKYLSFHVFILAFYYVITRNDKILECDFLRTLFVYSGILSIACAILEYLGFFSFEFWYDLGASDAGERTLEVFTANIAAYTNLVAALVLFSKNNKPWFNLLLLILCAVDLYVISYSGKRSSFVAAVFAIGYVVYRNKVYVNHKGLIALIIVTSVVLVPQIRDTFLDFFDRTISGFTDVYGGKKVDFDENSSTSIRAYNLDLALKQFETFTFGEYILGRGYLKFFIDNPLLESYLDMGIMGFLFYFYIIVLKPILILRRNIIDDKYTTLALLLALSNTFICISNNNPYEYFAYTPTIMLALYSGCKQIEK